MHFPLASSRRHTLQAHLRKRRGPLSPTGAAVELLACTQLLSAHRLQGAAVLLSRLYIKHDSWLQEITFIQDKGKNVQRKPPHRRVPKLVSPARLRLPWLSIVGGVLLTQDPAQSVAMPAGHRRFFPPSWVLTVFTRLASTYALLTPAELTVLHHFRPSTRSGSKDRPGLGESSGTGGC